MSGLGVPPPPAAPPPPPSSSSVTSSGSSSGSTKPSSVGSGDRQRRRLRQKGGMSFGVRKKRMFLDSGDPKVLVQKFGINVPIKKKRKYLKGVDAEFKFARQSSMPDISVPDDIAETATAIRESSLSKGSMTEESYDEGVIVEHLVASVWMAKGIVSGMLHPRDRLLSWKRDQKSIQTCNICMDGFTKVDNDLITQSLFDYAEVALNESLAQDPSGMSAWMLHLDAMSIHDPLTGHTYKYSASIDLRIGLWVAVRVSVITDISGMEDAFSDESGRIGESNPELAGTIGDFFSGYDMDEDEDDGEEMLTAERSCVLSDLASLFEMECEKNEKTAVLFAEPIADFSSRIGARFFPVWGAILEEYLYADEVIEEGGATTDEEADATTTDATIDKEEEEQEDQDDEEDGKDDEE